MTFDFFIGGFFNDHSYRIILNHDVLNISDYLGLPIPEHDKAVSIDANKNWQILVEFLTRCKWNKRYDSDILDGTQWELKVKSDSINFNSYGSNAYPEDFDEFLLLLNNVVSEVGIRITK